MTRYPTIYDLCHMNAQKMFDHVARHLMNQGVRCTRGNTRECLYRGAHGGACAVGALIPDALYSPDMEQQNVHGLLVWLIERRKTEYTDLAALLMPFEMMLAALQKVHDEIHPSHWRYALAGIADDFDLNACVLRDFPEDRDAFAYEFVEYRPANASAFVPVPVSFVEPVKDDDRSAREVAAFVALLKAIQCPPTAALPAPGVRDVVA